MSPFIRTSLAILTLLSIFIAHRALGGEISNLFLPGQVVAPDGQVSLYADFNSVQSEGRIPVYLVNKSATDLVLNTQDGDIYLKLQFQDDDGNWVRAQPHGYSWCGNSYISWTLRSGHYVLVSGYQPINGASRTVRYKLYSQDVDVVSNAGDGVVAELDIHRAANDAMSIREGSFEYVSKVALSDLPVRNEMDHIRDLRIRAILALSSERFDAEDSREVLLRVRERAPEMYDQVERAIRRLDRRSIEAGDNPD